MRFLTISSDHVSMRFNARFELSNNSDLLISCLREYFLVDIYRSLLTDIFRDEHRFLTELDRERKYPVKGNSSDFRMVTVVVRRVRA